MKAFRQIPLKPMALDSCFQERKRYFVHSSADAASGYVYKLTATAANVHDIVHTHPLIREDNHIVYGDSGYLDVEKRTKIRESPTLSNVDYRIVKNPSQNRIPKAYKRKEIRKDD